MSTTYTWTINALNCIPDLNGKLNYVVVSHYNCTGTDGTYTGSVYNTTSFTVDPEKPNYTPYADLTEAEVIGWVQATLGPDTVEATYANIASQIQNQINPPIVTPPLPWANSAATAA